MAWIEIHQSLPGHRKTLKAAARLHIDPAQMVGHMVTLWLWGLDNAPDGCIGGEPWMIAHAAGWRGDPDAFVEALHESLFVWVEGEPGHELWSITNWHEYAGKLIDRRAANVQRMRAARATNDARTVHERVEPQYRTVQNSTVPKPPLPPSAPKPTGKRYEPVDEEFIAEQVAEYAGRLGGAVRTRTIIDEAMNHKAQDKAKDKRLYVRGWLRREMERGTTGIAGANTSSARRGDRNGAGWG